MDLTGQSVIKTFWSIDPDTHVLTITFKDTTEATTFGTVVLESTKIRSMLDAMEAVRQFYVSDDAPSNIKHRTLHDTELNRATTTFE